MHKSGCKSTLTNYRPISLLPCLAKVLEKVILGRFTSFLNKHDIIHPSQYGFRSGHSTIHAVQDLITTCYDNRNDDKYSALILLDLKKAFDTVNHSIFLKKLDHYGIRGEANNLMQSYLSEHKQFVIYQDKLSSDQCVTLGAPQGSILGPLLFIIYINDLSTCTSRSKVKLFADDTCLCVSDSNLTKLKHTANAEMESVQKWMNANLLTLNPKKSVVLLINPKSSWKNEIEILISNSCISSRNSTRYLGIEMDDNLKFDKHIPTLSANCPDSRECLQKLKNISPPIY